MTPLRRILLCALATLAVAVPLARATLFTWYFQIDVAKIAQQSLSYAEELNKLNAQQQEIENAEAKSAEEAAALAALGEATQGNIDKSNPDRDEMLAKESAELKTTIEANELTRNSAVIPSSYDAYLANVSTWRAQMEIYRVKADALADHANGSKLTLTEWMAVQAQYQLVLGQIDATRAAQASGQAELAIQQQQRREYLRKKLLDLKRIQTTP